jgi:hypothetical protein
VVLFNRHNQAEDKHPADVAHTDHKHQQHDRPNSTRRSRPRDQSRETRLHAKAVARASGSQGGQAEAILNAARTYVIGAVGARMGRYVRRWE